MTFLASIPNFGPTEKVTAVGFEPTPLRTGALSQRLRPLGQTVRCTMQGLYGVDRESDSLAVTRPHTGKKPNR